MQQELVNWVEAQVATKNSHNSLSLTPLQAEASFRHFYRICQTTNGDASGYVLMVSPPEKENNAQFVKLAGVFKQAGIPVAEILSSEQAQGWYLLSDIGDRDLQAAYATADRDLAIQAAIDTLIDIQQITDPAVPVYSRERFAMELALFNEWFVDGLLHDSSPPPTQEVFDVLIENTQQQPQCCVHRDYHCRNLLFSESHQFGVVDFQDALIGPASYDLASLLHDCYHQFEDRQIDHWCEYYLQVSKQSIDAPQFRQTLDYCALQRQLKAIGIFARLKLRDAKDSHLRYIPSVMQQLLRTSSRYSAMTPLTGWLEHLQAQL